MKRMTRPWRGAGGGRARRCVALLLGLVLTGSATAAPPLVQSIYRNLLHPEAGATNAAYVASIGGFTSTNTAGPAAGAGLLVAESGYGYPIVGVGADFELGDVLEPPEGANLVIPPALDFMGGPVCAVWIVYAQQLIAVDMGAVQVTWTLQDSTTQTIVYTLSPNPTKRPVRLYWTEGQNAGPRIVFGSNYRVDIYYNSQIDSNDVWLADNMLHAADGAEGRFLLTYSRLDEATGLRKLLAFEIVEVLEPMSALQTALVGQRLLPQARPYATEDLFAQVVRGAQDTTGQNPEDVFVYQHTQGAKNGWVWATRETQEPWQIEIYWKAKEELDVLWPFEVDIYDVSWGSNAQVYVRADLAAGDMEPRVQIPSEVVVDVMPYENPIGHAVVDGSSFYTTDEGYCLLKYTVESDVWFEPVRSVSYLDPLFDRSATTWTIARELRPIVPGTRDSLETTHGGFPGYLYRPSGTGYNTARYAYPGQYVEDEASAGSYLFAVNEGVLEVWWSNPSTQEGLPAPVYFPSLVNRYDCTWPLGAKELVIASGLGNNGYTLNIENTGCAEFDRAGYTLEQSQILGCSLYLPNPNNLSITEKLTLEAWLKPDALSGVQYIVHKGANFRLRLNTGVPELYVGGQWYTASSALQAGAWQHLAVTLEDRGTIRFYLDGEEAGTSAFAGWLASDTASLRLGAGENGAGMPEDFFSGQMDEVRIWTTQRTRDEVRDHMILTVDPGAHGLRAYYRFEPDELALEGVARDTSFFVNDITLPAGGVALVTPGIRQVEPGTSLAGVQAELYVQNDRTLDGYNPNEEHAIIAGGAVYALRNDLNHTVPGPDYTSDPFVLLDCLSQDVNSGRPYMTAFRVTASNELYQFQRFHTAGNMFQPPAPIALMLPSNCSRNDQVAGPEYRDRKGYYWAKQAGDDGDTVNCVFDYYYPMQADFWFPDLREQPAIGTEIPWLDVLSGDGTPVDFTFIVEWPESVPSLYVGDTLTNPKNDLPAIRGQLSVDVAYQQSAALDAGRPSVRLIDPTVARKAPLTEIPGGMKTYRDVRTGCTFFSDLPPALRSRLFWNPMAAPGEELQLVGEYRERTDGHNYLLLNLLSGDNRTACLDEALVTGITGEGGNPWRNAIAALPTNVVYVTDDQTPFDSLALPTTGLGTGYVTVVFNNSVNADMVDPSETIDMAVFRVDVPLYRGRLDVIQSVNPLDKQISLYYSADFLGVPERYEFKWEYADPQDGAAPDEGSDSLWLDYVTATGKHYAVVGDAGVFGLADHYLRCTYRPVDPVVQAVAGTNFTGWTPPVLCEGWIKRVLKAVNPFEQRIKDFMTYAIDNSLSMIQQIGAPYSGDVPLNVEALDDYGLMPIYETINRQADSLSVDNGFLAEKNLALALLMVKGRLSDLYMVLGHEAYADALNPTVMLGSAEPVAPAEAGSLFCFQNQAADVLEEELALLRGRDDAMNPPVSAYPVYNRLAWNITADVVGGEVAYMLNYGISDLKGNADGLLNAEDAKRLYPQGHGDAYGHYLSAIKGYYTYLHHPNFSWYPQTEGILVDDVEVTVSFLHEKKFAVAAAARARAGVSVINRTWRQRYGEAPGWQTARDENPQRAWGVGDWGCRVGMGAYFDWLTGNSLLPPSDNNPEHSGIKVIDRASMPELDQLPESGALAQQQVDHVDGGANPLGVAPQAVPFDISSTEIDAGRTHFEQIYDRAVQALRNAVGIYNRVRNCAQAIRDQNEASDLDTTIQAKEAEIERQLIEIFGYPYSDDIGPGKLYPQGYTGPDLLHYAYVNTWDIDGKNILGNGRTLSIAVTNYTYAVQTNQMDLTANQSTISEWLAGASDEMSYDIVGAYVQNQTVESVDVNVAYPGIPVKPSTYTGSRRAEGLIQIALSQYITAISDAQGAVGAAQAAADELNRAGEAWLAKYDFLIDRYDKTVEAQADTSLLRSIISGIRVAIEVAAAMNDEGALVSDAIIEGMPKIIGALGVDATAPARGMLKMSHGVIHKIYLVTKVLGEISIAGLESRIKDIQNALERDLMALNIGNEARQEGFRIMALMQKQRGALSAIEGHLQRVESARMEFSRLIGEGERLQIERERLRRNWAADLNARRYRNMAYQLFRNDELVRYEQAFDLAARYVYLAARAYDYETGLLDVVTSESAAALMRQIVRARSLGRFGTAADGSAGDPLVGGAVGDPGLADVMARLRANWDVLDGRLGFNNPQVETGRFSIRTELFRLAPDAAGDANWEAMLAGCLVDNLRDLPAFQRYCLPFDPMQEEEPALVIPFSTTIDFRRNVFGRTLAGGDNAYDSTHFATKVRSAGVWFANFDNAFDSGLANEPRVYLVPVGEDRLRVPADTTDRVRSWQIVDQALPVPYALTDADWEAPDWSVLKNLLGNQLYRIRKYPQMRAYHDSGAFDPSEVITNSRLVGRSVWNSQWVLIIPGGTLLADADEGLARFVYGRLLPSGSRDGNGVKDIKLFFHTYSYAGN